MFSWISIKMINLIKGGHMTKSVLVEKVSERIGSLTKKQTEIVVDTVFDSIKEALVKGEKIEIRGFRKFQAKIRRPRRARNPKTGEKVDVPGKRVLHFKVGKALRDAMNPKENSKLLRCFIPYGRFQIDISSVQARICISQLC